MKILAAVLVWLALNGCASYAPRFDERYGNLVCAREGVKVGDISSMDRASGQWFEVSRVVGRDPVVCSKADKPIAVYVWGGRTKEEAIQRWSKREAIQQ